MAIICIAPVNAQNDLVVNYLQQVGDYAEIYNGKIESIYNTFQYENLPYYMNSDFTEASVIYKKKHYLNQKVRLDLFKEQLILLAPNRQYAIIVGSQNVEKVYIYNKTIVPLTPPKESGLKSGYYIQLLEKEKLQLYCKEYFTIEQKKVKYSFEHNIRYCLSYNNRYYTVKNKGSFSNLFPQYKKQINKFAKDNQLDFDKNKQISLMYLTAYCEELLTSTNK